LLKKDFKFVWEKSKKDLHLNLKNREFDPIDLFFLDNAIVMLRRAYLRDKKVFYYRWQKGF